MKNRKIVVVSFLVAAVLLLGVGYAALTDVLVIIGNAHIDLNAANKTFDERIYFDSENITMSSTGTGTTADVASATGDDATFTANKLATLGESSTFTFTIVNESNFDAYISIAPTKGSGVENPSNTNTDKFDVKYEYPDGKMITKNGGEIRVIVTVTVKTAIDEATSATFGIELTATSDETTETDDV